MEHFNFREQLEQFSHQGKCFKQWFSQKSYRTAARHRSFGLRMRMINLEKSRKYTMQDLVEILEGIREIRALTRDYIESGGNKDNARRLMNIRKGLRERVQRLAEANNIDISNALEGISND